MTGISVLMGNAAVFEELPPGLTTVMVALPALAIRLAATDTVSCVALTKVVGSAEPFHCTLAPERKPVPLTVRVKAGPVAVAEVGFRLVMTGVGGLMGNVAVFEEMPPGLTTVMLALPTLAIRLAATDTVSPFRTSRKNSA